MKANFFVAPVFVLNTRLGEPLGFFVFKTYYFQRSGRFIMPSFLQKLQTRWGVHSVWQVLVILVVFALTGFTAMYIKRPIFAWLGLDANTPWWLRTLVWLVTVLPAYQVFLLGYGFLLGQFTFFWNFEKRMFNRIGKLFGK